MVAGGKVVVASDEVVVEDGEVVPAVAVDDRVVVGVSLVNL